MASCSRATVRILVTILAASGIASAAAVPAHQPHAVRDIHARQEDAPTVSQTLVSGAQPTPESQNWIDFVLEFLGALTATFQNLDEDEPAPTVTPTSEPDGEMHILPVPYPLPPLQTGDSASSTSADFHILPYPYPLPTETTDLVITAAQNNAQTVYFTLPPGSVIPEIHILPPQALQATPTGTGLSNSTISETSTTYITRTVTPVPPSSSLHFTNSTYYPSLTLAPTATFTGWFSTTIPPLSSSSSTPNTTIPPPDTGYLDLNTTFAPLRAVCLDDTISTITIPLLSLFYGPNAYPSLRRFPGCQSPAANSSQAIRAPGLLNCTILGAEVQACQQQGRKVLLSITADPVAAVAGNADYGDPNASAYPFGPYFGFPAPDGEDGEDQVEDSIISNRVPNLFDAYHPPAAFALTLFSLFGEGHTERADLRPLGPDAPNNVTTDAEGIRWWSRPLGEEVVVDGFDVQVPRDWLGTYQHGQFDELVARLRELTDEAWLEGGAEVGGPGDLGADGKGLVLQTWL